MPADPVALDALQEILRREAGQGGAAEFRVGRKVVAGRSAQVGEVAPSSSGDGDLLAHAVVVLEDENTPPALCGEHRAEQSGSTAAEDNDIV